jgi:hypothetical protein
MKDVPKRLKRLMRQQLAAAHEEELRRAILPLAETFDLWRDGRMTSGDLAERIHAFHQGPVRDLWKMYNQGSPEMVLGRAIAEGILAREGLSSDLLDHLQSAIEYYESDGS